MVLQLKVVLAKANTPIQKQEEKGVITAPITESLLPKCRVEESLLADIISRKVVDHLPLYGITETLIGEWFANLLSIKVSNF